jgi:hypothetical protein
MVDVTSSSGDDDDSAEPDSEADAAQDSDADAEADYQYALQMQEELNGMRARPARNHRQVGWLLCVCSSCRLALWLAAVCCQLLQPVWTQPFPSTDSRQAPQGMGS